MPIDELPRGWDDPGRVAADLRHVGEPHPRRLIAELPPQRIDLVHADHDKCRFTRVDAFTQECRGTL